MERQSFGKVISETIKYKVAPDEVVTASDLRLSREPEKLDDPQVKLVYPISSANISEPRPTLKWEPVEGAEYFVSLTRLDQSSDKEFIDRPMNPRESNNETVSQDLDDGLYEWSVYIYSMGRNDLNETPKKAVGYFTVAKGGAPAR